MPLSKYNKYVGDANELMQELKKEYGDAKGTQIFYAMVRRKQGKHQAKR